MNTGPADSPTRAPQARARRNRLRFVLGLLGAATLLAIAAYWFQANFKRVTIRVPAAYEGEAARNPLLACGRLLRQMGFATRELVDVHEIGELPPHHGTLFFLGARYALSAQSNQRLLAWVDRGGHLVVVAKTATFSQGQLEDRPSPRGDTLLRELGVQLAPPPGLELHEEEQTLDEHVEHPVIQGQRAADKTHGEQTRDKRNRREETQDRQADEERGWEQAAGPEPTTETLFQGETHMLELPGSARPLRAALAGRLLDTQGKAAWRAPQALDERTKGHAALGYELGQGRLTVLSDAEFMTQPDIGWNDHAELALELARLGGRTGPVWLVRGQAVPSLVVLLARHAWPLLVALCALMVLLIWQRGTRHGPVLDSARLRRARRAGVAATGPRRELTEHVDASARLVWRLAGADALAQQVREGLYAKAASRTPDWAQLTESERHKRLATLCGEQVGVVGRTLAPVDTDMRKFTSAMRALHRLETQL